MELAEIERVLGATAKPLLEHRCTALPRSLLSAPGPDFLDRVTVHSDRPPAVLYQPFASAYDAVRRIIGTPDIAPEGARWSGLRLTFRLPPVARTTQRTASPQGTP